LDVFNVSKPPSTIGLTSVLTFTAPTPARQLAVYRRYVFVLDGSTKLYAVNVMP